MKTPGSGRKPGTPNKATRSVQEILDRLSHNPIEGMALIAQNKVSCGVCRREGRTRYPLVAPRDTCDCMEATGRPQPNCWKCDGTGKQTLNDRVCQSCYGTLWEAVSPELRGKMESELAKYVYPQRKAVEHSGPEGGPVQLGVLVKSVRADGSEL